MFLKQSSDKLAELKLVGDAMMARAAEAAEAPKLAEELRGVVEAAPEMLNKLTETHEVTADEVERAIKVTYDYIFIFLFMIDFI